MILAIAALNIHALLISFLYLVIVLAVIGGVIWCINAWICPLPQRFMQVLAIILAILVIIWAVNIFLP